jgi:hypothetical protein
MQTKTNLLVFSLAAILSLSIVAMGELPQAIADDDDDDKKKKKTHFKADCDQINAGINTDWDCKASFWLDKKGENLKYKIRIKNMDLTGWQTIDNAVDNVGKVHLHSEADANAHVLNIWKAPIEDDSQMKAFPSKGVLTGNYDDGDVTPPIHVDPIGPIGHHDTSKPLTANLDDLCNGDFFVMIHGPAGPGVLKGFVEPTSSGEKLCHKLLNGGNHDDDDDD